MLDLLYVTGNTTEPCLNHVFSSLMKEKTITILSLFYHLKPLTQLDCISTDRYLSLQVSGKQGVIKMVY